jgi:arsenical pump membrane protein
LIYGVGTLVTIFLSNDATAVVLTPAVYAASKQANAKPLPVLFICAFVANAASFVLPISNPANLVVYGARMPGLGRWLAQFGLASIASVLVTYLMLRWSQRTHLMGRIVSDIKIARLSRGGRLAAAGIALTAVVLLVASSLNWQLGLPTFLAGCATAAAIMLTGDLAPRTIAKGISWSIVPLVAGLFVLVEAVKGTGVLKRLTVDLSAYSQAAPHAMGLAAGAAAAFACNVLNNLPMGLLAASVSSGAHLSSVTTGALLIGVDVGPNLSVTGSLATILWLVALRRDGQEVSAWQFLRQGCLVMPPALLAALLVFLWLR